jgi:hypothetical protein
MAVMRLSLLKSFTGRFAATTFNVRQLLAGLRAIRSISWQEKYILTD